MVEASRESRETRRSREMWRKYSTMHRKLLSDFLESDARYAVCCRDVKVAASGVYDVRERIISSFPFTTATAKFAPAITTYGRVIFFWSVRVVS